MAPRPKSATKAARRPTPPKAIRPSARDALVQAAIEVLARNPGAPLDDVVARSGVGRATLFRHFPQRVDLVRAAGLHALRNVRDALAAAELDKGTGVQRLERLFEVLVPCGVQVHFVFVTAEILEESKVLAATRALEPYVTPVLTAVAREGGLDPAVSAAWVEDVFDALVYCSWWAVTRGRVASADAPRMLLRTFLYGLAPRRR